MILIAILGSLGILQAAPNHHADDDQFWSQASALLPNYTNTPAPPSLSNLPGVWSTVIPWTHTPVSLALLPNGKLLTYSGSEPEYWPGRLRQTHWALWDPATAQFDNQLYEGHEMFCAHPIMRTDGVLQTMGGRHTVVKSSTYDWRTNQWSRVEDMNDRRWYTTAVALPDGDVTTFGGQGGPNTAERFNHDSNLWNRLSGINWQPVSGADGFASQNWPFIMVAPDGRLFHFGPTDTMHWIDANGAGSRTSAGITVPGDHYPKDGAYCMYDSGKYLIVGGAAVPTINDATNACYTVDLTQTPPVVQNTAPMANARSHHNLVALPSGEVLALGGNTSGDRFSDLGSVYAAEVWNPNTRQWRTLASASVPRNYHSTATLLPDGRVFSGGGGFTSSNPNHPSTHTDAQLFTPPALLNSSNNLVSRPNISNAPDAISLGSVFNVQATSGLRQFSMIRMIATTHGNTSDQRFLNIPFNEVSNGNYQLISNPNRNVMVPGYWMLFGVQANGAYSEAKIIHVKEAIESPISGLSARYYDGTNFNSLKLSRNDAKVDFNFGTGSPIPSSLGNDSYSIRWDGWIIPDFTETYTFFTQSDDGTRLWVNGQQLINDWTTHSSTERSGTIALQAGVPVPIRLEYFENVGAAAIQLKWSSPRTPKTIIPPRALRSSNPLNEATVAADNRFELFIDGQLVSVGVDWNQALNSTFSTGTKTTIAIRAVDRGGPGALFGHFRINGNTTVTNTDWRASTTAPNGWEQPGFDDSTWPNATIHSRTRPAGFPANTTSQAIWSSDAENHNQVFFRYTIGEPEITALPKRIDATNNNINLLPNVTAASGSTLTFSSTNLPPGLNINTANGRITGSPSTPGIFNTTITGRDQDGSADSSTFEWVVRLPGQGEGSLLREVWTNMPGDSTSLSTLTTYPLYPFDPNIREEVTSFPVGEGFGDNYGTRLRGYIHAPITGDYTFWLSTDNEGSLLLGTNDNPSTSRQIASISNAGWASPFQWTRYPSQKSATIRLTAGQKYYLEILQRETFGGDHINLAWQIPGDTTLSVVGSSYLSPFDPNERPSLNSISDRNHTINTNISINLSASDPDNDPLTWSAIDLPSGINLNPTTGRLTGRPTATGTFNPTITIVDPEGADASRSFEWTINPALNLPATLTNPTQSGTDATFSVGATGGTNPTFTWNFGDGTSPVTTTSPSTNHNYSNPGRYTITLTARDANGTTTVLRFTHLSFPATTTNRPRNTQPILTTTISNTPQAWNVNPDQNTISVFNLVNNSKLAEIPVGNSPRTLSLAPNNLIWVTNKDDATLSIINPVNFAVTNTIQLPRGSQPHGIIHAPNGSTAWVALEATGEIAQLNPTTGTILNTYAVGSTPRHLAISHDSSSLFVSHFISPFVAGEATANPSRTSGGGFVTILSTANPASPTSIRLQISQESDFAGGGSGLPNYLGAPAISPSGDAAWIPSKKDNILRGSLRNGQELDHDNTVRSIASRINLSNNSEDFNSRIDFDNSGLPSAAVYGPYGLHLFVTLEGSRQVSVVDVYGAAELFRFDTDRAPQGLSLSPDGRSLLVHNFMSRTVSVHNITALVENGTESVPRSATLDPTASESLPADVLLGKQLFYDSRDDKVSREDYMSCASCHNDGGHDGRTWDFTGFGEGLRNTIDLRGRGGPEHGAIHWSANFDEFQDFER
ncbi:MAG: PA14 domain-containing protein, partial [Verrucomicrobiota bacterium]